MEKIRCDHCHLEFDRDVFIEDEGKFFCCKGCQGIYHLLKDEGLESFYDKVGSNNLAPPKQNLQELSKFESQSFKDKYIKEVGTNYSISLIIEGIHCVACIWLNEKILHRLDGIIKADINYTNNKAYIEWDPKKLKISDIIDKIRAIGYDAYAYDRELQEERQNRARKEYYTKMIVAVFCTMNIMWIAVAQYAGYFTGMDREVKNILNFAEWVLATPTIFYSGSIFFKSAWAGLRNKIINMDLLVINGALLTYFYSIYAALTHRGETYFESATMIVTFVLIGKFLEVLGKRNAADTLDKLNSQIPSEVRIYRENKELTLTPEEVKEGDIIELRAGEKAAIDGVLLSEIASFDESSISGESLPVEKKKGEKILSGSINIDNQCRYLATSIFSQSLLSKVLNLVEDALKKKPNIETKANELSQRFSTTILLISLATFLGWFAFGATFEKSFIVAISVIIIACPCALALATPVSTLVGLSIAFKKGVLFKEAKMLETMAKATTLVLDKTGTITYGKPQIIEKEIEEPYIDHLYSIVSSSNHPISKSIKNDLENSDKKPSNINIKNHKEIASKGISCTIGDRKFIAGSRAFLEQNGYLLDDIKKVGSEFFVGVEGKIVAWYLLSDLEREDAKEVIGIIKKIGLKTIMLTGDNRISADYIAKRVGIEDIIADCTPEDKSKTIDKLRANGEVVIMVGDGINDTIALSKSDIAIAMGGGSDIAMSASDVVLLKDSLANLLSSIKIGRKTYFFIKQNLLISLVYNALTIPLAVLGYIIPLIAAASMSLSSLIVVLNSMRIKNDESL